MASSTFNLIYHTTPHRGLELLVPVFERLVDNYPDKVHLDVYSSFGVYGWSQRDEPYKPLFKRIEEHPAMTYHKSVPNDVVREALAKKAHCFAYPSIWPETSCISLMEAMSAGLLCVHPNFAALPETAANWTLMYNMNEQPNQHAVTLYSMLATTVENHFNNDKMNLYKRAENQSAYSDTFYNWEIRKYQWKSFLDNLRKQPKEMPKSTVEFVFDTNMPDEGGFRA
jgi:glycosyltransferase involved in cell wall biosynthesis